MQDNETKVKTYMKEAVAKLVRAMASNTKKRSNFPSR